MTTFVLLWVLATIDAALIGYREAAGRNALIDKRGYFRTAMLRGALLGQAAVALVGCVVVVILAFSSNPQLLIDQFEGIGLRMLAVYIPYAIIIAVAFLVRLAPSVDFRSITSVLIFGPFTLVRPFVVVAGVIWGFLYAPSLATLVLSLLILLCMLGLEWLMGKLRDLGLRS